jgi:hypothetical protein
MWWAYCFSESMGDTRKLVTRLADWTSFDGTCVLPLCNPQKFDSHTIKIPYIDPRVPGRCMITAIPWAWIQDNGKRHDNMLPPQVAGGAIAHAGLTDPSRNLKHVHIVITVEQPTTLSRSAHRKSAIESKRTGDTASRSVPDLTNVAPSPPGSQWVTLPGPNLGLSQQVTTAPTRKNGSRFRRHQDLSLRANSF